MSVAFSGDSVSAIQDPADSDSQGTSIKSVVKAISILEALRQSRRPLRVVDLARLLNLSSSAVSRLASTLASRGLIEYDHDTGRLYLGFGLALLGHATMGRREIDRIALPVMAEISVRFQRDNRYVSLGRQYGGQVVYLRGRTAEMLQRDLNTVTVAPMHATAPGKVFAAWKTREQVVSEFSSYDMDPYTPRTITTIEGFLDEIAKVRRQGFALDDRELVADLRHVATPIFDHLGQVAATLSIGGPAQDMQGAELDSLTEALGHGALEASRQLGFTAAYPVIATPSEVLTPLGQSETPQAAD
jgi:DNA-binding IclR family transcriptional regulator